MWIGGGLDRDRIGWIISCNDEDGVSSYAIIATNMMCVCRPLVGKVPIVYLMSKPV
jgi:hypothetical protein